MLYQALVIIPNPDPTGWIELASRAAGAFQTEAEALAAAEATARAMPEAAGFSVRTIRAEAA